MEDIGVAGMVRSAAWLEHVCGVEVLSIGRPALSLNDCVLEVVGHAFFFQISLRGSWVWVALSPLDETTEPPEFLFNTGDGPAGWSNVRRFIQALERSGLTSLKERPIHIGEGGPNSFTIA
jgi:hypothetical protein